MCAAVAPVAFGWMSPLGPSPVTVAMDGSSTVQVVAKAVGSVASMQVAVSRSPTTALYPAPT